VSIHTPSGDGQALQHDETFQEARKALNRLRLWSSLAVLHERVEPDVMDALAAVDVAGSVAGEVSP